MCVCVCVWTKLRYSILVAVLYVSLLKLGHVSTLLKNILPSLRKNSHDKILKGELKE